MADFYFYLVLFSFDGSDMTDYRESESCFSLACLCTAGGHSHTCSTWWHTAAGGSSSYRHIKTIVALRAAFTVVGCEGWMDGCAHRFKTLTPAAVVGKINRDVLYTSVTGHVPLNKNMQKTRPCTGSSEGWVRVAALVAPLNFLFFLTFEWLWCFVN